MSNTAAANPQEWKQSSTKGIPIRRDRLTRDPEVHARAGLHNGTVSEYATAMMEGVDFPALVVFNDGHKLWLADGFHRDAATVRAGIDVVVCDVRPGTRRDAVLYSVWANARHGLQLTNAEKRRAVERLLRDKEWSRWSDTEIARRAGVGKSFVHQLRRDLQPEAVGAPRLARRGAQVYELRPPAPARDRAQRAEPPPAPAPTSSPSKPPAKQEAAPNYIADWLRYLVNFTVPQFVRWQKIVAGRTDRSVLAEAVDVVMRETGPTSTP